MGPNLNYPPSLEKFISSLSEAYHTEELMGIYVLDKDSYNELVSETTLNGKDVTVKFLSYEEIGRKDIDKIKKWIEEKRFAGLESGQEGNRFVVHQNFANKLGSVTQLSIKNPKSAQASKLAITGVVSVDDDAFKDLESILKGLMNASEQLKNSKTQKDRERETLQRGGPSAPRHRVEVKSEEGRQERKGKTRESTSAHEEHIATRKAEEERTRQEREKKKKELVDAKTKKDLNQDLKNYETRSDEVKKRVGRPRKNPKV